MRLIMLLLFIFSLSYSVTYNEAIKNFQEKNYEKSYKEFLILLKETNYKNIKYNYYLGFSAYKLKLYKTAISAFERILFYKPYDTQANLEIAKIYFTLNQLDESMSYLDKVLTHSKNKRIIQEAQKYLKKIELIKYRNTLTFTAVMGGGYDTNVNNDLNNTSKSFTTQLAIIDDIYKEQNFNIENNLIVFNKIIINNSENNFMLLEYKPSIVYNNIKNGLIVSYSEYSNHSYIRKIGAFSQLKWKNNESKLKIYFNKYLQNKDSYKDAYHIMINNINYKKIYNNNLYTTTQIDIESDTKEHTSDVDYKSLLLNLKDNYIISKSFIIAPIVQYDFKYYPIKDITYNKHQKNNMIILALQTVNKLKNFDIQTNVEYKNNNSNINLYKYHKWIFSINIIKQFKGL